MKATVTCVTCSFSTQPSAFLLSGVRTSSSGATQIASTSIASIQGGPFQTSVFCCWGYVLNTVHNLRSVGSCCRWTWTTCPTTLAQLFDARQALFLSGSIDLAIIQSLALVRSAWGRFGISALFICFHPFCNQSRWEERGTQESGSHKNPAQGL